MPISDDYLRVPLSSVVVGPDRQRTKIDTKGLRESIANHGVLKPIILTRDYLLVAGERRLTASRELGLEDIPARFIDEVAPEELQVVELEENLKRSDLGWLDQVRSIAKLHAAYAEQNEKWSEGATAEALALSVSHTNSILRLAAHLDNPKVLEQPTLSTAMAVAERIIARRAQEAMNGLLGIGKEALQAALAQPVQAPAPVGVAAVPGGKPEAAGQAHSAPAPTLRQQVMAVLREAEAAPTGATNPLPGSGPSPAASLPSNIIHADFNEWAKTYSGPKFNFLHCDFPYGVGLFDGSRLGADDAYADTKEVYFALIETLCSNLDNILTPNAHVMFWFSMDYYARTFDMFRRLAPSIVFFRHPLVWVKSDNAGLLPDRNRGPRRIYETALMGIRGERFVAKAKSNAYSAPTERSLHPSTKPEPVLKHFFEMFVDNSTSMLDPTCGAGSSIRAAEAMGCERAVGIERDAEFHKTAQNALAKARSLRAAAAKQQELLLGGK